MAVKKLRKKKWRFRGGVEEFRTTSVFQSTCCSFYMAFKEIIFPSYSSSQCKNGTAHYFPPCVLDLRSMCKDEKLILTQANHHVICIANMILQLWRCARRLNWDFSVVSIHGSTMMCFVFRVFLHRRLKKDKAQFICYNTWQLFPASVIKHCEQITKKRWFMSYSGISKSLFIL